MEISVHTFTFNAFQENTYVLADTNRNCVIIDPGCYERFEQQELSSFIAENNLTVLALLSTHSHVDHVLGNSYILRKYNVDHYSHELDVQTLISVERYAYMYGFQGYEPSPEPNRILKGGEVLIFGDIRLKVIFTPGHAPGHVVYYNEENKFVINGDVLFSGSFGRVDLPGGSMEVLKKTIHEIMFQLPEDTVVHCGHGPATTIGREKRFNYILNF